MCPKFRLGGPVLPCTPPSGKIFVPEASTLLCLMAFLVSTFQLLYFPRYYGVPYLHQGALRLPDAPQRRIFCTESEFFTISNCAINFNYLVLVLFEISGGPKFTLGGHVAPMYAPQRKNFCTPGEYVSMSNGVFNFNFLALLLSEILEGSQIYTRGPTPPGCPLAEKFLYPKRVLDNI